MALRRHRHARVREQVGKTLGTLTLTLWRDGVGAGRSPSQRERDLHLACSVGVCCGTIALAGLDAAALRSSPLGMGL
jgi:hypothetical protein